MNEFIKVADKVWLGFKLFDDDRMLAAKSIGEALNKFIGDLNENS